MYDEFIVKKLNFIGKTFIKRNKNISVKTRYQQRDIPCIVRIIQNKYIHVKLVHKISSITPGQSAVFYKNERCLGGGIIHSCVKNCQ